MLNAIKEQNAQLKNQNAQIRVQNKEIAQLKEQNRQIVEQMERWQAHLVLHAASHELPRRGVADTDR